MTDEIDPDRIAAAVDRCLPDVQAGHWADVRLRRRVIAYVTAPICDVGASAVCPIDRADGIPQQCSH